MSLAPLLAASPAVQIHVAAAVLSMIGAIVLLTGRKGTPRHKMIGKLWVGAMAITAISSFSIQEIRVIGKFSLIHLLSILALVGLVQIVYFARKRRIREHEKVVHSLVFGALGIAGTLTFLPGRTMNAVFFDGDSVVGFVSVALGVVFLWLLHRAGTHKISRFTS